MTLQHVLLLLLLVSAGNGQIDFNEFLLLVNNCEQPVSADQEIRDMFNAIDKDRSGFVDMSELKSTFVSLGVPLTDTDIRDMLTQANVKGDRIYYEGQLLFLIHFQSHILSSFICCHELICMLFSMFILHSILLLNYHFYARLLLLIEFFIDFVHCFRFCSDYDDSLVWLSKGYLHLHYRIYSCISMKI